MKIIGVDIDGVLANFTAAFAYEATKHTGIEFPVWDTENFPKTWNWDLDGGMTKEQSAWVWKNKITQVGSKFWEDLEPLPGAPQVLTQLNKLMKSRLIDCYFLTHRAGDGAKQQTEKWLYEHGVDYPTVLISGNKVPLIHGLGIQAFVDDKPETIQEVAQYSMNTPLFGHVYKKSTPYNQMVKASEAVRVVGDVKEFLEKEGLWNV